MAETSFRPLTAADIEEVAAMVVRCDLLTSDFAPAGWKLPEGHAEREVEVWREDLNTDRFRAEVGEDEDGTILGVVATLGSLAEKDAGSGHVTSLFVEPATHGRGIGARLLSHAERWLKVDGCDRATLNVLDNSPAMGFYEANGWTRDGRTKLYEPFDMPTVGYSKRL